MATPNAQNQHRLPEGKHPCLLIARRNHEQGIELLAEVESGRYRGRRIKFCAVGTGRVERAAGLNPGDRLVVALRYKPAPVVTNFLVAGRPTVVTVLGGCPSGDHGNNGLWPIHYQRTHDIDEEHGRLRLIPAREPLVPSPEFPEELEENVRCALLLNEVVDDVQAEAGSEGEDKYPAGRILTRLGQDYGVCLLKYGENKVRLAHFESTFARYCRAEGDLDADEVPVVSAYQYCSNSSGPPCAPGGLSPGYQSPTWARWLHVRFPADGEPDAAIARCRNFVIALRRLGVCRHQVLPFTLGGGDLEVMFPSAVAFSLPRPGFEFVAGYLCAMIADWSPCCGPHFLSERYAMNWTPVACQPIDKSLYAPFATCQLPNTRVGRSGAYKVRVGLGELFDHDAVAISALAFSPRPFNPPPWHAAPYDTPIGLWGHAVAVAVCRSQSIDQITMANRWVYPGTFDFMLCGAEVEHAGNRLFTAAMNLLDFGCPYFLLEALLSPAALMSGMPRAKVRDTLANAVHMARKARPLSIEAWDRPGPEDDATEW